MVVVVMVVVVRVHASVCVCACARGCFCNCLFKIILISSLEIPYKFSRLYIGANNTINIKAHSDTI